MKEKSTIEEQFDLIANEYDSGRRKFIPCFDDYYEKIRSGKQEKPFYEVIFQIGNKDDMGAATENGELAARVLDKFLQDFMKRNPQLHVYSAHLHMDEATPHLHIDFIPFTTGSTRGLSTRVSLKQALADQGIKGEGRSMTERDLWVQREKEALAGLMLEHGIEWEQKDEHREHLSVLEYKKEQRAQELAEVEQTLAKAKQQKVAVREVAQIEAKPLPLTSKVIVEREDYDKLVSAAQKYVVQEQKEGKLRKMLREAKAVIADLKEKLATTTKELASLKSVTGRLRTADLEEENSRLKEKLRSYEDTIERNNLWSLFGKRRRRAEKKGQAI